MKIRDATLTAYDHIERAVGLRPERLAALHGGCVGTVHRAWMPGGSTLIAKSGQLLRPRLDVEGEMLRYLARRSDLPVPAVLHASSDLLLMQDMPGLPAVADDGAQRHAADLLAGLHAVTAPEFGLHFDTLIGGLRQRNAWSPAWLDFFRERRLIPMAVAAFKAGRLPRLAAARVVRLADSLDGLLTEPARPALLHGDVWSGNVLTHESRVTAFLDPAIFYGHPEADLAFITLFGTFGEPFFERYREHHPIEPGFWTLRRHVYNIYPLLVHVRLFGGGYLGQLEQSLVKLGF